MTAQKTDKSIKSKAKTPTARKPVAGQEISDVIGQRLRTFYEEAAQLPVPDRFLDLLQKLEQSTPSEKKK